MEMVVYVAILSLIIAVVLGLLLWVLRVQIRIAAEKELVESTQAALTILKNEIGESESLYTLTTTSSQISLATRRNPPDGEDSTYVDFFLCGTRLCIKRESQNPLALTSENILIQNLAFEHIQTGSVSSIQIMFDAVYNNPSNRSELEVEMNIQTTVSQRSY